MNNSELTDLSDHIQQMGWKVLDETGIAQAWESIGATVNVVGSLRLGLMIKNLDIDLHIYTPKLDIEESFSVIGSLAGRLSLKEILCRNLIDTEEECIEWHALYEDKDMNLWKFDMIHIRKGSKYEGMAEQLTDAIAAKLTSEIRDSILRIKYDVPEGITIPGIEIYRAVFEGNVRDFRQFERWREEHPLKNILWWMP